MPIARKPKMYDSTQIHKQYRQLLLNLQSYLVDLKFIDNTQDIDTVTIAPDMWSFIITVKDSNVVHEIDIPPFDTYVANGFKL